MLRAAPDHRRADHRSQALGPTPSVARWRRVHASDETAARRPDPACARETSTDVVDVRDRDTMPRGRARDASARAGPRSGTRCLRDVACTAPARPACDVGALPLTLAGAVAHQRAVDAPASAALASLVVVDSWAATLAFPALCTGRHRTRLDLGARLADAGRANGDGAASRSGARRRSRRPVGGARSPFAGRPAGLAFDASERTARSAICSRAARARGSSLGTGCPALRCTRGTSRPALVATRTRRPGEAARTRARGSALTGTRGASVLRARPTGRPALCGTRRAARGRPTGGPSVGRTRFAPCLATRSARRRRPRPSRPTRLAAW